MSPHSIVVAFVALIVLHAHDASMSCHAASYCLLLFVLLMDVLQSSCYDAKLLSESLEVFVACSA